MVHEVERKSEGKVGSATDPNAILIVALGGVHVGVNAALLPDITDNLFIDHMQTITHRLITGSFVLSWLILGLCVALGSHHQDFLALALGLLVSWVLLRQLTWGRQIAGSTVVGMGLALAMVFAAISMALLHTAQQSDYGEYVRLSRQLYSEGRYDDRGMLAWRPPGMAFILGFPLWLGLPTNLAVWFTNSLSLIPVWLLIRRFYPATMPASRALVVVAGTAMTAFPFLMFAGQRCPQPGL